MYNTVVFCHHSSLCSSCPPSLSVWQDIFKALASDLQRLQAGFGDRRQLVSKRGQMKMIYSPADLTGEKLLLPQLPSLLNSHVNCMLFHRLLPQPLTRSHTEAHVHTRTLPSFFFLFFFLQVLFMFEWSGLCVCGLPCPLKRALINDYFINQEVLAGSKWLWGQGCAEVLNQFSKPAWLDIFYFLAARQFIIILLLRCNGIGKEGGLDVKV